MSRRKATTIPKTKLLAAFVGNATHEAVGDAVARERRTLSDIVAIAVEEYLTRHSEPVSQQARRGDAVFVSKGVATRKVRKRIEGSKR